MLDQAVPSDPQAASEGNMPADGVQGSASIVRGAESTMRAPCRVLHKGTGDASQPVAVGPDAVRVQSGDGMPSAPGGENAAGKTRNVVDAVDGHTSAPAPAAAASDRGMSSRSGTEEQVATMGPSTSQV